VACLFAAAFVLFLYMTIAGLLWADSLVLPGFLGLLFTLGLWVWAAGRREGRALRLDDNDDRPWKDAA
jgi:hypothetical protein